MGNDNTDSNLKCGVKSVVTPKQEGEIVQGTIYIQALKPIERTQLHLQIKGHESVEWYQTHSNGKQTYTVRYGGQSTFFNVTKMVVDFNSSINKGMYQIPFQILMPPGLPAPMRFKGSQNSKAVVEYKANALFKHPKYKDDLVYGFPIDLKYKNRDPIEFRPFIMKIDHDVECCCCTRGHINGIVQLDKCQYSIGDKVNIHIKLQQLQNSIQCINVVLRRKCYMKATQKSKSFYNEIQTYKLPGIPSSDALRQIQHQIILNDTGKGIYPTYVGTIIILTYQLSLTFQAQGICAGSAEVVVPFLLKNENYIPVYQPVQFDIPGDWSPHQYPAVDLGSPNYMPQASMNMQRQTSLQEAYPGMQF